MGHPTTPTTRVAIRALTAAGLRHRRFSNGITSRERDFSVKKMMKNGEAEYTYVVFYNREAEALALKMAGYVEGVCRSYGHPFSVRKVELGDGRWYCAMDNR